jgi:hypothetical protein|tara:strand:- start:345 stop:695 length:351 start_codon:yes stop_codon:yes gene_type:complete
MAVTQKTAVNFSIDQGADLSKEFTVTTDGSTAYDISGLTLQAQMRKGYDSSTATATFTASIVTATSGIYKLTLTNEDTADIDAGRYVYDVELRLADSTLEKVHYGLITVHPEATKL